MSRKAHAAGRERALQEKQEQSFPTQEDSMRKFFPVVLSGLLAVSFSQLAAAQSTTVQGDTKANVGADASIKPGTTSDKSTTTEKSTSSSSTSAIGGSSTGSSAGAGGTRAGPTDDPNVTMDAQGREHVNKGKHKGQLKDKKDRNASAGSTSKSKSKSDTQLEKK
jgi:hypothetical protein